MVLSGPAHVAASAQLEGIARIFYGIFKAVG